MEIEGMIIMDLGETEGISKAGKPWKKHEWVMETMSQFPRKVKFHVFNDRIGSFQLQKRYVIQVDVESREFNGKWYTDINAYASREAGDTNMVPDNTFAPQNPYNNPQPQMPQFQQPAQSFQPAPNPMAPKETDFAAGASEDELPF